MCAELIVYVFFFFSFIVFLLWAHIMYSLSNDICDLQIKFS